MEEQAFSIQIEEPESKKKKNIVLTWFSRLVSLDEVPNPYRRYPVFIIIMCILHLVIYLSTYLPINEFLFFNLFKLFVPCMRPTPASIGTCSVRCDSWFRNSTCYYDDELKKTCFSFMYPYQLWRFISVNLFHMKWYHLLSNLFKQLIYGIPLEWKYGSVSIAVIYWLTNVGGALCFMLKNSDMPAIGASGSLYGLMLFWIVDQLIAMQRHTDRRLFILMQIILLVVFPVFATLVLTNILMINVGHSAHFGGGLVGFLFGIAMSGYPFVDDVYRKIGRYVAVVLLLLSFIITLVIFFSMDAPTVDWILYREFFNSYFSLNASIITGLDESFFNGSFSSII